jgi:type I restriction enzyme M protein
VSGAAKNKYCRSSDLSNEASVESFFVLRLLDDLGYADNEIRTKESVQSLRIPRGSRRELYKPDYVLLGGGLPRWLIDAKATEERIEDFTYQGAGYALQVNRKYKERPLRYYMLTNGLLTRVYVWDQEEAVLSLRFGDFEQSNTKFETLRRLLAAKAVRAGWATGGAATGGGHALARPEMDAVKRAFLRCHRMIWSTEKMSPQAAFVEFAKLLFVKLWEDRRLRDNPSLLEMIGKSEPLPPDEVRFSTNWIAEQEANDPNPVDALLFRRLVDQLEIEILQQKRKRIFEKDERLRLSPGTIRRVVKELEHYYLFGIDEDLNGRMFEAFLVATMRGQDLGQYFTPRSVVKVMTRLAHLRAERGKNGVERVLDACCGTGGFLIEALTEMRRQIWDNRSLTKSERTKLLEEVANEAIFGIDAGRDPAIARIARINMYLHGDGGSRVYMTDSLKDPPEATEADSLEVRREVEELRKVLHDGLTFDCVLTNPPFSMGYSTNVPEEEEVLESYTLESYGGKRRPSLRSSVMFIERYADLLRPGGRLLTVIDDSVLGGNTYSYVRDFIRERFIIRGIISLHGDAFQRAGARAKTSILYLVKRSGEDEEQPAAFVYESRYIGLDDVVPKTRLSVAARARKQAEEEMAEIVAAFDAYLQGKQGAWLVEAENLGGRLDAKYLRPWSATELEPDWKKAGAETVALEDLVEPAEEPATLDLDTLYTFLRITYEGRAERGEEALGSEVSYARTGRTREGDIVVSNINAVNKAICVIPKGMDDLLVSNEFTVLRLKPDVKADPLYLWSVLRSSAVIAEWISGSSGVGRHRVSWDLLRKQRIPLLPAARQKRIGDLLRKVHKQEAEITRLRDSAATALDDLGLEDEGARERLARAKPPR